MDFDEKGTYSGRLHRNDCCDCPHRLWQWEGRFGYRLWSAVPDDRNAGNVAAVITTALGDNSLSDSCWTGLNALKDKYGIEIDCYEMNQDQTKAIPALTKYAESGNYNIIVSGTYSTVESAQAVIEMFPNQKFIHYDASVQTGDSPHANAFSMEYKQNEGAYLVGWLAGKLTQTGTIASLGAAEIDVIWDSIYGYLEGAKFAKEDVEAITSFVGDWEDVGKAKDLANDAMGQGADILFHIADGAGAGMFEAIAEAARPAFGVLEPTPINMRSMKLPATWTSQTSS